MGFSMLTILFVIMASTYGLIPPAVFVVIYSLAQLFMNFGNSLAA